MNWTGVPRPERMEPRPLAGADGLCVPDGVNMTWLDELSPDERRSIDNGALLGERHRAGEMIAKYRAVIEHQEKQPGSPTRDALLVGLAAQVDLLLDEHALIQQRIGEHRDRQRREREDHERHLNRPGGPRDTRMICGHGYFEPCPVCDGDKDAVADWERRR